MAAMTRTQSALDRRTGAAVESISAYHVRIPLKKTIRHASHVRDASDNVVVAVRLDDGTVGYGEGVPREYVTGETIDTSLDLLSRADWRAQLAPVASFAEGLALARRLTLPSVAGDERRCVGNAARCGAELALLDAFGHRFGVSLSSAWRELAGGADLLETRPDCRYSGAITSKSAWRETLSAWKQRPVWFAHCKIKVGTEGQDDVARVRRFRRILGRRIDLRVDANEAWHPEDVVEKICELEPFGITSVEQPVAHEKVACLAEVRQRIRTPIMLDESLCGRVDAERAIAERTCDLFNIRLSKCGGLIPSIELAALARRHGLGYQLGCQVGETGILSAAGRAFACMVKDIRYVEGSYDHWLVRERLTRENLTFEWRGIAPRLTGPGLGITVEPHRLERVTVREERLHG